MGAAGTGYVNNTTGKLTFVVGSFSRADFLFGHNISLVYNQEYVGRCPSTVSAGYGFKLNTSEYLLSSSYINAQGEEVVYYIWTDSDGTQHDFMPDEEVSNLYRDVDGLLLTLKIENGNYLMQDMSHNKRFFTSISIGSSSIVAVLNYEEDQNGNKLYYTNNDIGQNSAISLVPKGGSNIPFEQYTYNNYGCVKEISMTNDANAQKVRLYYSPNYYRTSNISGDYSGYLKKIEYIKNNQVIATTSYEYDNTGRLTAAYDEKTWSSVHYTYSDGKVSAVQEIGSNQEIGQKLGLSYGNGYSEVRSSGTDDVYGTSDDIITRYIYDRNGRVTSTYSTDVNRTKIYGAASGEYETQENIKNNIKTSIAIGGSASNYIYNGGFEKRTSSTSASGWNTINNITFVNGENNNRNHHGNYSARIDIARNTSYVLQQNVFLPAGEYTLSMDIKSYEAEHVQIIMQASSQNGTGNGKNERISVNEDNASDGFVNYSLHFKASNYNSTGGELFRIEIAVISDSEFVGDASYVVIDNVMLEESIGQSGYSMVEFGNFEDFHRTGTKATYKTVWTTSGAVITEQALLGKVLKLDPNGSTSSSRASQTIYTASSVQTDTTPKTFIVSGMGKGTYQVASGNFEIQVKVTYADNTVDTYFIAFQDYFTDWQFVSKSITTANKLVKKVVVDVVYENNPGVGYFDNIYVTQVVNESLVTNEYYENGLIQVQRNGYYEEVYEYNNNNNLTRMANNRGELYDYTYTSTNDVDTVTYSSFSSSVGNSLSYPYEYADAHNLITTVPKTTTDYNYNRYGLATSTEIYNGTNYTNSTQRVRSSYTYEMSSTRNFGALTSETDELGITTQYFYDTSTGNLLASLNTNKRTGICYTYDVMGNIATVNPATYVTNGVYQAGTGGVSYTYDTTNLLQSITTQSTTYEFAYDNFGNAESVDVGANEIVRYEYNSNNGKLNTIYYANGFSVEYEYDEFDNISKVWYSEGDTEPLLAYEYKYNAYGQLYQFNNLLTEKSIIYSYDANKRLIDFVEYDTDDLVNAFATKFVYDDKSRISRIQYSLDYQSDAFGVDTIANSEVTYWLSYNSDNSISRIGITTPYASGGTNYTYDIFKRVASKYSEYTQGISANTFKNTVTYEYATRGNYDDSTLNSPYSSSLIRKYTSKVNDYTGLTYTYTYDESGNITKIKRSDGKEFRYVYDSLDQLIREDNSELNKTYIYSYDSTGNIISKTVYPLTAVGATLPAYTDKINYEYNDSNWGDKLTSYDGNSITYDAIGNPLSYFNGSRWTFTWKNGRRLATASTYGYTLSFEYNDEGIRTSKTVNGVEHAYQLNGSQIVAEVWGGKQLLYFYDADGSPIGMQYRDLMDDAGVYESYWFEKNLQGDIVKVYSANGTLLVSYSYDAWGSASVQYHNGGGSTNAVYNPFRYRGYYYDAETGLYYLQSRYYNPEIGRFINADSLVSTGQGILGYSMFAYCGNNPVNMSDPSGNWPRWITAAVTVVAAVVTVVAVATGNFAAASVAAKVTMVAGAAYLVQSAHYDDRASKNKGMDEMTYEEAIAIPGADPNVSDTFHDFSGDNNKVCLEDGREGIYDSSGKYVDDPRDIGTYNYFVPKDFWSGAGHFVVDVFPYFIFGNNDNDPGPIVNFVEKWVNNLITLFE